MINQANFLQSLGWAVLNSFWQLALLWVIYQIITGLLQRSTSSFRSSLAFSLLAGGFAWFIYTFSIAYLAGGRTIIAEAFASTAGDDTVNTIIQRLLPTASLVYLVFLVFRIFRFIRNYRYAQALRTHGLSRIAPEWRLFVDRVAQQMNIRRKVKVWVSEFISSPVTIGFLKPVILVPLAALSHLTPQQMEAVLLHEVSHIRRYDYFINLLINLIRTILYFNPFVQAFVKIIEKEREKSCDEMVLQFQYDSYEYASALLTLEKAGQSNRTFVLAANTGRTHELLTRVELIMGIKKKKTFSWNRAAGLLTGIACLIGLNIMLLFAKPVLIGRTLAYQPLQTQALQYPERTEASVRTTTQLTPLAAKKQLNLKKQAAERQDYNMASLAPRFIDYAAAAVSPALVAASLEMVNVPDLNRFQQEQIKTAIEASKKVMEDVQWKTVEKDIADAFTPEEKEELRATYDRELSKVDWKKWELDLARAYNQIDWEKANSKLALAVNQVRLDSIRTVYNNVITRLDGARRDLAISQLKGIPDTDITLKEIEKKKVEVMKALNQLKAVRVKKVVHL